jgi:hypothetical protein
MPGFARLAWVQSNIQLMLACGVCAFHADIEAV